MDFSDAHCHLADPRLRPHLPRVLATCRRAGIRRWMVNATRESDWPVVAQLRLTEPGVAFSLGLHPWWQGERSPRWREALEEQLRAYPEAGIGETGLDRWMPAHNLPDQLEVLADHLRLSRSLDRPVSLHCLRAWPELAGAVQRNPPSKRGFLLHSYSGPEEMVMHWVRAGAFFSFSPAFLHPRKARVRAMFRTIPIDRLLVESDAPDMAPPEELALGCLEPLGGSRNDSMATGIPDRFLNHPLNLLLCVQALAADRGMPVAELAAVLETNRNRLFSHAGPGGSHCTSGYNPPA
jgi:TatD DNase family protein